MAARFFASIFLLTICSAGGVNAQVRENAYYEMQGAWAGGVLRVTEIHPPEDPVEPGEAEIEGQITALDMEKRVLQIGPVTVQWTDSTPFLGMKAAAMKVGLLIEAAAKIAAPRRLAAIIIERSPESFEPNFFNILGPVTRVRENAEGSVRFEVLGLPVFVPPDVYQQMKSSRPAWEGEEDDEPSRVGVVTFEGEYELKTDYQKDFALDRRVKDDLFRLEQELQLRLFYRHSGWISLLLEGKGFGEHELYTERGRKKSEGVLERGETWLRFEKLFGLDLSVKFGRQNFEEPRRWWWDDELDAVGARYRSDPWFFELGVAREVLPTSTPDRRVEPENEGVVRILARTDWRYSKDHRLSLFFLHQNDRSHTPAAGSLVRKQREDESDAKLWWGGLRAMGRSLATVYGDLSYWGDVAVVAGKEKFLELEDAGGGSSEVESRDRRAVRGWAVDVGGRWSSQLPGRPMFTLGYAVGSGDRHSDRGADRAFRQTGLQSNDEEFRTYGELLRPELSNLKVATAAVQFPILTDSHIEFAYRDFRQYYSAPFLREARIETDPTGLHKRIGQEWMIYAGLKEWEHIEIEWVGAAFRADRAYGPLAGRMAYSLFMKVTFEF